MFSSHSLIQNTSVNNDDALVNVIKQSLNLRFAKNKKQESYPGLLAQAGSRKESFSRF